ncbi:MAG: GNAT family N-acetyltransferase [Lysobacterales bacterium 69-70]|nr:GNAT family N-acetyltransferase [Xanthomonadaceae bacterium]ODU35895.1 MAG: GNAT family N-acetyltransferase [Xanthomonadaceae bacterium SCN 69-320]ODV18398.1 MAG: GNAT family N-acetyltransferase [Xanthomonadaceae bacterium SCN 69-25]OJY97379.1 MAG: GNAT family N-acetyltransferase [Xanthomonadales bacterium 69-70]
MHVRHLEAGDRELICRHREAMFRDAGRDDATLATMTEHFRSWLTPRLRDGSYFGFMLEDQGRPIAGIGLMLIDWPPHPLHPTQDCRGYVLNVYVEPDYRRRGLARELMQLADAEFARRGVSYCVLHATEQGRPLYQELGWRGTAEMAKAIRG